MIQMSICWYWVRAMARVPSMKQPLRSATETAGISAGDPLPMPGSSPASLRPCVFAFISPKEPYARSPPSTPNPLLPPAGEGEPRFYCDAEYEKKPEPCGAPKAGVRRR
jgi:hypothetical protein